MATNYRAKARRQMRVFVMVWTFITLLMGLATFLAIYFTYNNDLLVFAADPQPIQAAAVQGTGVAEETATEDLMVVPGAVSAVTEPVPTATALPTLVPATSVPLPVAATSFGGDAGAAAVAMAQAEVTEAMPTAEPTLLPVNDETFDVGIQLQHAINFDANAQRSFLTDAQSKLGVRWVKQQLPWLEIESEKDNYNWAIMDMVMPLAQETNTKMMLSIVAAPDWAREPGADLSQHGPPADNAEFAQFVAKVLQRYPGQIHAIEVWNEHNLDREWTSVEGLSAANYVEMFRVVVEAAKAVDPGVIMISGALSPTGGFITPEGVVTAIDDFTFMEQQIQAGLLEHADCVGAHHNGYNIPPTALYDSVENDPTAIFRGPFDNPHHSWSFRSTLDGYAQRIAAAGDDTKLCITEFGWAVTEDLDGTPRGFEFADDNTLAEQAEWFPEALTYMEESGFVWIAYIWNMNYGMQANWNPENDNVPYSLIGPGWLDRPAIETIREWMAAYNTRLGRS